jgi:hypothetical protein
MADEISEATKNFRDEMVGSDGKSGYMGQVKKGIEDVGATASKLPSQFNSAFKGIINTISSYYSTFSSTI